MNVKLTRKDFKTNYQIIITPKPQNCNVCPFYLYHEDDEYGGYDYYYCQFGAKNTFGCALERMSDCPLDTKIGGKINKMK